jgi:hypothetical protein
LQDKESVRLSGVLEAETTKLRGLAHNPATSEALFAEIYKEVGRLGAEAVGILASAAPGPDGDGLEKGAAVVEKQAVDKGGAVVQDDPRTPVTPPKAIAPPPFPP